MKSIFSLLNALQHLNNRNFLFYTFFFSFLFLSESNAFSQSCHADHKECKGLEAAPFNGYYYTPPADWILEKMNMPSQSLIGDPPCSTISVTYTGFTPEAEAAFQYAVEIWETILSSPVDITIDANWEVLDDGILGSTGTNYERNFTDAPTTDFYAASIANQIAGTDISPGSFDMFMTFSSVFDWYLGTDGNPNFDEYDFVTVVLHEIGHGLGFASSKSYNSFTGVGTFGSGPSATPFNYDRFLTSGSFGVDLLDLSGTDLGDAFVGGNVFNNALLAVAANGGAAPKMYAPATYAPGSSISHWDEATYPAGNPQSLMTPQVGSGEAIHNPGEMTIGLLEDLGWTICYATALANDLPCDATPITCGETVSGDTELASISGVQYTCAGEYADVFYSFEGTPGVEYTVSVNGDNYDGILAAYTGICDGVLTSLACADDGTSTGIEETISFTLDSPQTVLIGTAAWAGTGAFELTLGCEVINDLPCNAIPLSTDGVVSLYSNVDATADVDEAVPPATSCQVQTGWCATQASIENSVWFSFIAPPSGRVNVLTCNPGASFDTQIAIYSVEDCADYLTYTLLSANDDVTCSEQLFASSAFACVTPGSEYYVQVDGYNGLSGDIAISISEEDGADCEAIGCLNEALYQGTTLDGTDAILSITSCAFLEEYSQIENAVLGSEYTFTGIDDTDTPVYLTVRSGTYDGPILGAGFSPLTITSDLDGDLFVHYNTDELCGTSNGNCVNATVQCISCALDCPVLGGNFGDPCDDGNPNTINDVITPDCDCIGVPPACTTPVISQLYVYAVGEDVNVPLEGCIEAGSPYNIAFFVDAGSGNTEFTLSNSNGQTFTISEGFLNGIGPIFSPTETLTFTGIANPTCEATVELGPTFCAPNNQPCNAEAVNADGTIYLGSNVDATADESEVAPPVGSGINSCQAQDGWCSSQNTVENSIWYSFTAPPSGNVTVSSCNDGTTFDTQLAIYSASDCNDYETYILIGANDDLSGCSQLFASSLTACVVPGETYFIQVDGYNGANGDVALSVSEGPAGPCTDCPILEANIGDACDDGNVNTINDIVTADCNCEGEIPPALASLLTLPCGGQVIQITGSLSGTNGGGTATSETRTIYSFAPDGVGGIIPSYSGSAWPYVLIGSTIDVSPEISASISYNELGYLSVNGRLAYQFVGDESAADANGPSGPWSYFLPNGDESQDACPVDCPLLDANIGDPCDDANPGTENDVVTPDCLCQGTIIYDCPILGANIGDVCDDGDANTINDTVNADCDCVGDPIPANDLCENAEELSVYEPGECPENQTIGTTIGASDDIGQFSCDSPGPWPDVFYTFNSGSFNTVQLDISPITQTDMVYGVSTVCGGDEVLCGIGGLSDEISVAPNTVYFVRIAPNLAFGSPGTFSICVSGVYDCPAQSANIGDACDDGDANTINDTIDADCNCSGEVPESGSLSGTAEWNNGCGDREITFEFYTPGTAALLYTFSTTIDGNGDYNIDGIAVGNYDIYAKIDGYLANGYYNETISLGANALLLGSSIAGDINNNNGINISDFSILNVSFGSSDGDANYNYLADMNCDGLVNIIDFSILNIGFGQVGAQP